MSLESFIAEYELERQWEVRRYLGQRAWERWEHQYWMYWYYIRWNWRSMTQEEAKIIWPAEVTKPKRKKEDRSPGTV